MGEKMRIEALIIRITPANYASERELEISITKKVSGQIHPAFCPSLMKRLGYSAHGNTVSKA